ncbi:CoA-binding protein [Candidatus Dojkabacteria bacterium]|nr:CoA-binding protein [Candidatus Dojkabacteria bacterium]
MNNFHFLTNIHTIAVIGLSDNPERPSYKVAQYLINNDYSIIPVNPNITEVFGRKSYASLQAIPKEIHIDLVDIFRDSNEVLPIVEVAISMGIKYIWLQDGVKNDEAVELAQSKNTWIIADTCLMKVLKDYEKL